MIDIEKARALVETLKDYAEHPSSFTDISPAEADATADLIAALLDEVERLNSPVVLSEWQKLVAERDALMSLIRDEIDENTRLRVLGGAAADENITAMIERVIAERGSFEALWRSTMDVLEAERAERAALARDARELLAQMRHIRTHLYAATVQRAPTDDRIIADHVEQAYLRANEVINSMEEACDKPSPPQAFGNDL